MSTSQAPLPKLRKLPLPDDVAALLRSSLASLGMYETFAHANLDHGLDGSRSLRGGIGTGCRNSTRPEAAQDDQVDA